MLWLRVSAWLGVGAGLWLCACNEDKAAGTASEPSASAAPSVSAEPLLSLSEYCGQACKKSAECGIERARKLAEIRKGDQLKLLKQAEAELPAEIARCTTSCNAKPVADADLPLFKRHAACLKLTKCAEYEACVLPAAADAGAADAGAANADAGGAAAADRAAK